MIDLRLTAEQDSLVAAVPPLLPPPPKRSRRSLRASTTSLSCRPKITDIY